MRTDHIIFYVLITDENMVSVMVRIIRKSRAHFLTRCARSEFERALPRTVGIRARTSAHVARAQHSREHFRALGLFQLSKNLEKYNLKDIFT